MSWGFVIFGAITGVVTGVIANLATHFFTTVCLPAYRDYTYKGVKVDGDWTITHESPQDEEGLAVQWDLSVSLSQKAYTVDGRATARFRVMQRAKATILTMKLVGQSKTVCCLYLS